MPKQLIRKFNARAKKIILVGYQGESANYRLYDPEKKTVSVSRNVSFREQSDGEKRESSVMSETESVLLLTGVQSREKDEFELEAAVKNEDVVEAAYGNIPSVGNTGLGQGTRKRMQENRD